MKKEYIELEIFPASVYLDKARFSDAIEGKKLYDVLELPYKVTFICGGSSHTRRDQIKKLFGVQNATTT